MRNDKLKALGLFLETIHGATWLADGKELRYCTSCNAICRETHKAITHHTLLAYSREEWDAVTEGRKCACGHFAVEMCYNSVLGALCGAPICGTSCAHHHRPMGLDW